MNTETKQNQNRIRQEVERAFENNEHLVVVSERNILAQKTSLRGVEKVLRSALLAFESEGAND